MTTRTSTSFVLGVIGALGVLAWSGCGPGGELRTYCEGSDCYTCDAYGCSPVAPSAPGSAEGAEADAGPLPGTPPGADAGPGAHADASADAGSGAKDACTYSSECEDDKVCADGQCLSRCEGAPCASGFTCDKGVCKPDANPGTTCTADAECGEGRYCDAGACAVDTRPKPNCSADDQCGGTSATPKKCLDGFCKYTCTTDQYCRTIDGRIGYCAKDGVCRSAAEAGAECLRADDCGPGASCIENRCR